MGVTPAGHSSAPPAAAPDADPTPLPELVTDFTRTYAETPARLARTPALSPNAPVPAAPRVEVEGVDGRFRRIVVSRSQETALQGSFIQDLYRIGKIENFKVLLMGTVDAPLQKLLGERPDPNTLQLAPQDDGGHYPWGQDDKILLGVNIGELPRLSLATHRDVELKSRTSPGATPNTTAAPYRSSASIVGAALGKKVTLLHTYLEGGNLLTGKKADGSIYALVGSDSLLISTIARRNGDIIKPPDFETRVERAAAKLQGEGAFAPGSLSSDNRFSAEEEVSREIAETELGLSPGSLIVMPQRTFHIDMHIRPLGYGEVLVDDPREDVKALTRALHTGGLSRNQRLSLRSYLTEANLTLASQLSATLTTIDRLEKSGLQVRRVAGVFSGSYFENNGGESLSFTNFMNAVPGRNEQGGVFYITNDSRLPILKKIFSEYLKGTAVARIYFVGSAGGGQVANSSLMHGGGIDCRTVHEADAE